MLELVSPSRFRVVVVIAVHNHTGTVGRIVDSVRDSGWRCIVVDDGSSAVCAAVLDALAVHHGTALVLVRLASHQGKGAAVTAGLREAADQGYSHAAQIDADGRYDPNEIGRFVARARRHPAAVICGYPLHDSSVPRLRLVGRQITRACVWLNTLSFAVRDAMCGLRVYPLAGVVSLLDREVLITNSAISAGTNPGSDVDTDIGTNAGFDVELLVRLQWRGVEVINQHTRVAPASGGSRLRAWREAWLMACLHGRLFMTMLKRHLVARDPSLPSGSARVQR